jgi:hypothetical protein
VVDIGFHRCAIMAERWMEASAEVGTRGAGRRPRFMGEGEQD